MIITLFSVSLFVALIRTVVAQTGLSIDTPTLAQCQPTQITWTNTSAPYDLAVVSADDMCGPALKDLGPQNDAAVTWTVDLAAGTQVVLFLEDGTGEQAWSSTITVANSDDSSCLASSTPNPSASKTHSGGAATPSSASSSPTPSAFSPAGAANAGLGASSGALSTQPLCVVTLLSSAVLAVAFTL